MIDQLSKPYAQYKDTGVPWLERVPAHWQVRRLKTLCTRSALYGANVAATSYATAGVRFLRTTDINEDGQLSGDGVFVPKELVQDYLLTDGDILISRSGTIGRSFLYSRQVHGRCAYAGYLVRFVPATVVSPKYVFLFTKTHAFAGFLRVMAISSTIENVNGEKYANAALPLPPPSEQAAIIRFLDHADRRIRCYIRAREKLIALLEEQRRALVHETVTRGVETATKLKATGDPWFPEVPTHWDVMPMRRVIASSLDGPHHSPEYLDQGIPFLSARNIRVDRWSLEDVKFISRTNYEIFCQRVKPVVGDVLYTKGGTTGIARAVDLDYPF
ncbi:MAG: restriction endonuclease subunit S [Chloroflexi bacterium]|nr:restriction endonuclease subunit S [Chloroflexota bacterium]